MCFSGEVSYSVVLVDVKSDRYELKGYAELI